MELLTVNTKIELERFIKLPFDLHREHPQWVPPFLADDRLYFDPDKSRGMEGCDIIRLIATRNGRDVGRILGLINHRSNEFRGDNNARFAFFESTDDIEIAQGLLRAVEDWAREHGVKYLLGPKGFTNQEPVGYMVDGFEHEPTLSTYTNFAYLPRLLEKAGYEKYVDYVVYKIPMEIPPFYEKIYQRIMGRNEFQLLEFSGRKTLKKYIVPVFELMNETYRHLDGYQPLTEPEMHQLAQRFLPLIDPRFIKVVLREGEVAAFILGIPNMAPGLRKAGGKLLPFGIFQIKKAARNSKQLDLLLGAIAEKYRGRGLDVLMGTATYRTALAAGFERIDSHLELENNTRVRAEMERAGGEIYKRYRIFKKEL